MGENLQMLFCVYVKADSIVSAVCIGIRSPVIQEENAASYVFF